MKRFVYEVYFKDQNYHEINYWNSNSYREAKKEINSEYKNDDVVITMIAEIKYEREDDYGAY